MYDVGHTWHLLQCLTQFQCFNVCAVSVCILLDVGVHAAFASHDLLSSKAYQVCARHDLCGSVSFDSRRGGSA